jgi:hypothetical protein
MREKLGAWISSMTLSSNETPSDYMGMSYGPEVAGYASKLGISTTSVVLNGANANATYRSLEDLKARGVKVILSVLTAPLEALEILTIADELGLFGPEYTWLDGAAGAFANPQAIINRSRDPARTAEMFSRVILFTTDAKVPFPRGSVQRPIHAATHPSRYHIPTRLRKNIYLCLS